MKLRTLTHAGLMLFANIFTMKAAAQSAALQGSVSGHVYDGEGRPLVNARVIPFPLEVGVSGSLPYALTNIEGAYKLVLPAFGRTRICASKTASGYPDTTAAVFASGNENEPEVSVGAGSQLHDIDIRLPPPDGILDLEIVDAITGTIVPNARITLRRNEETSIIYSTDVGEGGVFQVALPARAIQIDVRANGYESWRYRDISKDQAYAKLSAREHTKITIRLNKIVQK